MQRCDFCATRVAADAQRCWLCLAAVAPSMIEEGPDDLAFLPHPAHVWTGPLARTPVVHTEPDALPRAAFSRWRGGRSASRGELKLLIMLIAMLAAAVPYTVTGSHTALLLFAAPFGLSAMWVLRHVWRRDRVARVGHHRGFAVH